MAWDEVMLNSEEIKALAIAIIKLCLYEGISKLIIRSVSRLVSRSVSQKILLKKKILISYQFCGRVYG